MGVNTFLFFWQCSRSIHLTPPPPIASSRRVLIMKVRREEKWRFSMGKTWKTFVFHFWILKYANRLDHNFFNIANWVCHVFYSCRVCLYRQPVDTTQIFRSKSWYRYLWFSVLATSKCPPKPWILRFRHLDFELKVKTWRDRVPHAKIRLGTSFILGNLFRFVLRSPNGIMALELCLFPKYYIGVFWKKIATKTDEIWGVDPDYFFIHDKGCSIPKGQLLERPHSYIRLKLTPIFGCFLDLTPLPILMNTYPFVKFHGSITFVTTRRIFLRWWNRNTCYCFLEK